MTVGLRISLAVSAAIISLGFAAGAQAQQASNMTFFVTSTGVGKGADLGGLAGADRHCQPLAQAAGAGGKTWHAYLSTQAPTASRRQRARPHRQGPVDERQGRRHRQGRRRTARRSNNLTKQTALTEKGDVVNGRGDTPNMHDILTGSQPDGTAFPPARTRPAATGPRAAQGAAMLGHTDRTGLRRERAVEVVELVASLARPGRRLQPGRSRQHRRRRPALLLRGELTTTLPLPHGEGASPAVFVHATDCGDVAIDRRLHRLLGAGADDTVEVVAVDRVVREWRHRQPIALTCLAESGIRFG